MNRKALILPTLAAALLLAQFALAASITGTVHNGTTNKPSAGDDVILISLQQRMQEMARAKTDARGHYSIEVPDQGMHLIRVDHQKASYFQPAPPSTTTVDIQVFDVAATVPGITTEANVLRLETDPQGLHVTQSYFVKNDSTPPRTQFSNHSYDIYLPPDAKIEGAAAMGPGGMPVASSPAPAGEKGHYTYLFPLRPGETQFQVTYSLPYSGSAQFTPRLATSADNVVVMLPKSMTFKPDPSTPYQPINDDINAQTFVAKGVTPAKALGFHISGSGALPRDVQTQQPGGAQPTPVNGAEDTRPGGGLGNPIDTPDPLNKYKWWILSGVGLVLAIAAAFFLRRPAAEAPDTSFTPVAAAASAAPGSIAPGSIAPGSIAPGSIAPSSIASGSIVPGSITPGSMTPEPAAPWSPAPSTGSRAIAPEPVAHRESLLNALKEELFALETDRAQGNVGEVEYASHKQALEAVIRRALTR